MKIILHAGMGKTGTSALQRSLSRAREKLALEKIIYPDFQGGPCHMALSLLCLDSRAHPFPRGLRNISETKHSELAADVLKALDQIDPSDAHLLLLSTEYVFYWPESAQRKLKSTLSKISRDIEVVCWIRHPIDYYISLMGQRAKTVGGVAGQPPIPPEDMTLNIQHRVNILKTVWTSVRLFPFDKEVMHCGDVISDFQKQVLSDFSDISLDKIISNVAKSTPDENEIYVDFDDLRTRAAHCFGDDILFYCTFLSDWKESQRSIREGDEIYDTKCSPSAEESSVDNHPKHHTLDRAAAFNASYREKWRDYLGRFTQEEIEEKLLDLTSGMDTVSCLTCRHHVEIAPYFFPHPILKMITPHSELDRRILPKEISTELKQFGFFGKEDRLLARFRERLHLPESPLPEMLTHSGLAYVKDQAKKKIRKHVVIDAGAYIGDTAKLFHQVYRAGKVFAIEPDEINFSRMSELCEKWDLSNIIIPVQAATAEKAGVMTLWGEGVGSSAVQKAGTRDKDGREVPVISIDDLARERRIKNVAMIKLDVEGSEYDTILGARETITTQLPILIISIYHTAKDFFEIKPMIESWELGYTFQVRKTTPDLIKEFVLIAMPRSE